jgi:adenylate cyclase
MAENPSDLAQGDNLFGDAVNIAARLEALAEPGGICISGMVRDQIGTKLPLSFADPAEQQVKNIAQPIKAHQIRGETSPTAVPVFDSSLPLPDKPSIAVLPFANMSGDPEQEYFADGMIEEIITALSRIRWLFVIARNSTFTYKGQAIDVKQVGRELGVRYVLEGSVRKAGQRVRITGQLIDALTGTHRWADRFDGCAPPQWFCRQRRGSQRRLVSWSRRSSVIRITDPPSPGAQSATCFGARKAAVKIPMQTAARVRISRGRPCK